jgi:TIR domain
MLRLLERQMLQDASVRKGKYDAFISHATEDKDTVVRPLAAALVRLGFRIWLDETELHVGDSLRKSIDAGLSKSRYGIVVLSKAFFAKNWPKYELDGLVARELRG